MPVQLADYLFCCIHQNHVRFTRILMRCTECDGTFRVFSTECTVLNTAYFWIYIIFFASSANGFFHSKLGWHVWPLPEVNKLALHVRVITSISPPIVCFLQTFHIHTYYWFFFFLFCYFVRRRIMDINMYPYTVAHRGTFSTIYMYFHMDKLILLHLLYCILLLHLVILCMISHSPICLYVYFV